MAKKKRKFKSAYTEMSQRAGRIRGLQQISGNRVIRKAGLKK